MQACYFYAMSVYYTHMVYLAALSIAQAVWHQMVIYNKKRQLWPNLRYYGGICLEGVRKATNNFGIDSVLAKI